MNIALPDLLREATWPLHREVERSGLMRRILGGRFERAQYVALLYNLHAIYATLEPLLLRHAQHPWLAAIHDPRLFRADALRDDLRVLEGSPAETAAAEPLMPATHDYVARLQSLDRGAPQLLAAHAYVRYLGDLSGGQALARVVARALALTPPAGVRFYDFGPAAQVEQRAAAFRAGLAQIPADAAGAQQLATEAQCAFELHGALFRELDPPTAPSPSAAP